MVYYQCIKAALNAGHARENKKWIQGNKLFMEDFHVYREMWHDRSRLYFEV